MSVLSRLFGISTDAINGVMINLLVSLNEAMSGPSALTSTNDLGIDLFSNLSFGDNIQALLPMTSRQLGDFHQITFGVINNKSRLIVTNILSKDVENNSTSIGDKNEVLNQLSLNGLHSMMTSLTNQIRDDSDPMYTAALQVSSVHFLIQSYQSFHS